MQRVRHRAVEAAYTPLAPKRTGRRDVVLDEAVHVEELPGGPLSPLGARSSEMPPSLEAGERIGRRAPRQAGGDLDGLDGRRDAGKDRLRRGERAQVPALRQQGLRRLRRDLSDDDEARAEAHVRLPGLVDPAPMWRWASLARAPSESRRATRTSTFGARARRIFAELSKAADGRVLASWAEMCPGNHESAGTRKSGKARILSARMREREPVKQPKAWMSWSSGKDSATALEAIRVQDEVEVTALLCTVNAEADRVAMHGVRRSLLEAQAAALGLPLVCVDIPSPCPNDVYEARMADAISQAVADDASHVIFGDLYLADVRAYRESQLDGTGVTPLFPLWGRPTDLLARDMLREGVEAILTCVDRSKLDGSFVGRAFDAELLADLPGGVDPCGENGEFHTFVWDGPGFGERIDVVIGERVERDGFAFCDVLARPRS